MVGIYKITSPNGRVYIGQSVNIKSRLRRYKNMSIKTQGQTKVWRSLKKYGAENHKYEVIAECKESLLNQLERYYQEEYDCVDNGLNCHYTKTNDKSGRVSEDTRERMSQAQKGNKNWLGKNHTEDSKQKIRESATGRKFTNEVNKSKGRKGRISNRKGVIGSDNKKSIPIRQYDLNYRFIKKWDSASEINRVLGFGNGNICSCCRGNLRTAYGFIWKYH